MNSKNNININNANKTYKEKTEKANAFLINKGFEFEDNEISMKDKYFLVVKKTKGWDELLNRIGTQSQAYRSSAFGFSVSELAREMRFSGQIFTFKLWQKILRKQKNFYKNIKTAADKMFKQFELSEKRIYGKRFKIPETVEKRFKAKARKYVRQLMEEKSFSGLYCQWAIIKYISILGGWKPVLATEQEESKGIDGFINNKPVQIKPESYKHSNQPNQLECLTIYYRYDWTTKKLKFTAPELKYFQE